MINRRNVLAMGSAAAVAPAIARAAAIDAKVRTGTITDVEHVVILMQENRGFDHYFGTMNGVRGFGDRFPIPLYGAANVWVQRNGDREVAPFPLETDADFDLMRALGTPHNWPDAQAAWDHGRMSRWPEAKTVRSMAYYRATGLPFQFALADAFTICDAYHCSIQAGTNTNRLFLWSGTNGPSGKDGGPSIDNSHDSLPEKGGGNDPYLWTTYPERLQAAAVSWRIYEDMADNFGDNPLVGFHRFRQSLSRTPGSDPALAELGLSTRALDGLRADVMSGALPQVSWIISPAADSEHPGPSSPAQGADYTARVIEALTADPDRWSRTVLLVMFDENDGFFDHMPPPAPPSRTEGGELAGASTVDTDGEYHLVKLNPPSKSDLPELMGRPYGLGARAPMYVISPWSRGGWVNSEVFDHTSVIRFLEKRFGVMEPNITPWRRAVCGDLTSAFDFKTPNTSKLPRPLPETKAVADRAHAIPKQPNPAPPAELKAAVQTMGPRPSRALPYALEVDAQVDNGAVVLRFLNSGPAGAVFHVYDRRKLQDIPRRYTLGAGAQSQGSWQGPEHDLWVIGPNGFHRHVRGAGGPDTPAVTMTVDKAGQRLTLTYSNPSSKPCVFTTTPMAYGKALALQTFTVPPQGKAERSWSLAATRGWYDLTATCGLDPRFERRFAGRAENGKDSISDPAMGGPAILYRA